MINRWDVPPLVSGVWAPPELNANQKISRRKLFVYANHGGCKIRYDVVRSTIWYLPIRDGWWWEHDGARFLDHFKFVGDTTIPTNCRLVEIDHAEASSKYYIRTSRVRSNIKVLGYWYYGS